MREHLGSSEISEPTGESDLRLPVFEVTSLGTGRVTTGKLDRGMPWGIQVVAYSAVSTGYAFTPWPFNESSLTLEVDHQEGQVVLLPLSFRIF